MSRASALLLLGPTGSGKTPLGNLLEREGLGGHPCHHFDFGDRLRRIAAGDPCGPSSGLSRREIELVDSVLRSGALLEDEQFPIAEKAFRGFLTDRGAGEGDIIILNGLPRHVGQARALEPLVNVEQVLRLVCETNVVLERIRSDSGGDRTGRTDDSEDAVRERLESYQLRTAPLVSYYRERGAEVQDMFIRVHTRAEDVRQALVPGF